MLENNRVNKVFSIAFLIFSFIIHLAIKDYPKDAVLFPYILISILVFLSIILFINSSRNKEKEKVSIPYIRAIILTTLVAFMYIFLIDIIGYYLSTMIYFVVMMVGLGLRDYKKIVIIILGTTLGIYLVFQRFLSVPIPKGMFFK